jgi:hypothetical protein
MPEELQYFLLPAVRDSSPALEHEGRQLPTGLPFISEIILRYAALEQAVQALGSFSEIQALQVQWHLNWLVTLVGSNPHV